MGTSKIIFASGVFVIVGMYALSLRSADSGTYAVAQGQALRNQAEQIALSGIRFACVDLGAAQATGGLGEQTVNLMSGSVKYSAAFISPTMLKVTTVGTCAGHSVTYLATVEYVTSHWKIKRVYQAPDAAEYSRLN